MLSTVWCLKQFWLCMRIEPVVVVFSRSFFFFFLVNLLFFAFIAKTLHLWG